MLYYIALVPVKYSVFIALVPVKYTQVTVWNLLLAQTLTFRHDARVICDFPALRSRNVAGHARVASCSVSAITTDPIFFKTGPIF